MHAVHKYSISGSANALRVPLGAKVLHVDDQYSSLQAWVLVDPDETRQELVTIRVFGTGHPIPDVETMTFIGTALMHEGSLIFHVFEDKQREPFQFSN